RHTAHRIDELVARHRRLGFHYKGMTSQTGNRKRTSTGCGKRETGTRIGKRAAANAAHVVRSAGESEESDRGRPGQTRFLFEFPVACFLAPVDVPFPV